MTTMTVANAKNITTCLLQPLRYVWPLLPLRHNRDDRYNMQATTVLTAKNITTWQLWQYRYDRYDLCDITATTITTWPLRPSTIKNITTCLLQKLRYDRYNLCNITAMTITIWLLQPLRHNRDDSYNMTATNILTAMNVMTWLLRSAPHSSLFSCWWLNDKWQILSQIIRYPLTPSIPRNAQTPSPCLLSCDWLIDSTAASSSLIDWPQTTNRSVTFSRKRNLNKNCIIFKNSMSLETSVHKKLTFLQNLLKS